MTRRRERTGAGGAPAAVVRPAAIVFDMDGLLLDTERIVQDGFLHACRAHGVAPHPDAYRRCVGATVQRTRELLMEIHGPDFPYDAIAASWNDYCDRHLTRRPPPLKPGARTILETARSYAIPCGLATSTWDPEASERLASAGLAEFFATKVTGDQVTRGKPDPEPYRTAASRLQVDPARAWALEDSPHGVRSALAAGLRVFHIPDLVPPDATLSAPRPTVLESLFDVDLLLRRSLPPGKVAAT